jgi:DNA end-binding protein Ku
MRRPIWTGTISFGLVSVPVKLFTAVSPKDVHFHLLHDKDGGRIKNQRVCSVDGAEVPYEHVVKGYEISPGEYVETTPEELAKLVPEDTRRIDLEEFVELGEIDPIFYEHTYYLAPDRGGAKAYALLHRAMLEKQRVGLGRVVIRTKQYLCAIRPAPPGVLVMSTMLFADEIVPAGDIEELPSRAAAPAAKELRMAEQLVESLAGKFEADKYEDTYREKVLALLEKKAAGERVVVPKAPRAGAPVDLMKALKASLEKTHPAAKGERRAAPKKRATKKKKAA